MRENENDEDDNTIQVGLNVSAGMMNGFFLSIVVIIISLLQFGDTFNEASGKTIIFSITSLSITQSLTLPLNLSHRSSNDKRFSKMSERIRSCRHFS